MTPEQTEEALARIDAAIGPPENETSEQREKRKAQIERDHRTRQIRKGLSS